MKRVLKVLTNYSYKRVSEYSGFAHGVVGSLTNSTYIATGKAWAQPILEAVQALDAFTEAHPHLNTMLTAELQVLREVVLAALSKAAGSVNQDFAGNEAALRSSGFELAAEPQAVQPPAAPTLCEIVDGPSSGTACIRIKRAPYTTNVKWFYTTDPGLPLEQWTQALELTDELTITGLVPGTRLHAQVACINGASTLKNLALAEARPRYVQ
jgi:hypothetical protein